MDLILDFILFVINLIMGLQAFDRQAWFWMAGYLSISYVFFSLFLRRLQKKGMTIAKAETFKVKVAENRLKGAIFVFTGFRDAVAEQRILTLGGTVASGVNKATKYLVTKNPGAGSSKLTKAKQLGVTIIDPTQLAKVLK